MKNIKNLIGFRTNKLWKKIIAGSYYIFCLLFIFSSVFGVPEIKANIYDMVIYKLSAGLMSLSFLLPFLFISNCKFKEKIPLLKKQKWWSDVLSIIIIFVSIICCSEFVNIFHSNDYLTRYESYIESQTKITYNQHNPDIVPEHEKSDLSENELKEELKDLTTGTTDDDISNNQNNQSTINNNSSIQNNNSNVTNNTDSSSDKNQNEQTNNNENINIETNIAQTGQIKIHYIDVGQGDSIFIELPNKSTMLIDAGESYKGQTVVNYISNLGYTKIDYLIGTHPHSDHIGGLATVINNFNIGKIYMPKAVSTSKTYENLLNTISQKGLKVTTAKAGVNILNQNNLIIDIIAPNSDSYSDLNNYSAVLKITYGNKKFLFMGDAEVKSENEIYADVYADVIKVGHHGSDTSSSESFINKVKAKYAIISVGTNNKYDHPYQIIIDRWVNSGAKIYRTDLNGTIIVTSNGSNLNVTTSK